MNLEGAEVMDTKKTPEENEGLREGSDNISVTQEQKDTLERIHDSPLLDPTQRERYEEASGRVMEVDEFWAEVGYRTKPGDSPEKFARRCRHRLRKVIRGTSKPIVIDPEHLKIIQASILPVTELVFSEVFYLRVKAFFDQFGFRASR